MHQLVRNSKTKWHAKLQTYYELIETSGGLSDDQQKDFLRIKQKAEAAILLKADVVCTTCVTSFDKRLKNLTFGIVLIDEATQACEPECILPMLKGAKHVVLVGDHCQLGPVIMCKQTIMQGLSMSLFERLIRMGNRPIRLQIQYRMHPSLSVFPSDTFYEGSLQNGVSAQQRTLQDLDFPWPHPDKPMFFFHTTGTAEISGSGTSYLNKNEAVNIQIIVTYLLKLGLEANQIGIITPYEAQRSYLFTYLERNCTLDESLYKGLEIASVDSFQGREKDFIIMSCVRSSEDLGIGFLSDPRRLNVSITRAKYGLIIVGNARVLSKNQIWCNLLNHFQSEGALVEGSLSNLTQMAIPMGKTLKYLPDSRSFAKSEKD